MTIPAGSVLTFEVRGSTAIGLTGFGTSPDSVRNDVTNYLTGFFYVDDVTLSADSLLTDVLEFSVNWSYTATVTIETRVDYADITDVGSVVAHAFYQAAGALPTVTSDDYGQTQSSGLPVNYSGTDLLSSLGLQSTASLLVLGVLVLVAIVVFSPAGREVGKGLGRAVGR